MSDGPRTPDPGIDGTTRQLNDQLLAILTEAGAVLQQLPPDTPLHAALARIAAGAARAAELGNRLLSYTAGPSPSAPPGAALSPVRDPGRATVLLVDRNPATREAARSVLEGLGYRVLLADDSRQALQDHGSRMGELELLILDQRVLESGDREAFRALRQRASKTTVLVIAGRVDPGTANQLLVHGVAGIIKRPFSAAHLDAALARLKRGD
jgi:CheY-like chemotaxis protein